jgi:hypothetical protein
MKFHIIGNGENVEDILKGYDLSLDELKNENKHIRLWDKLIPGTKLKIPILSENLVEDINEIEPFIEDYYPKIKIEEEVKVINDFEFENSKINEVPNTNDFVNTPIESKQEINFQENNNINNDNIHKEERKNSVPEQKRYYRNNAYYFYQYPYYRPIIYVVPRH